MPTPPEWHETARKVREKVLDIIEGKVCLHVGDRRYSMAGSTAHHAVISVYCKDCDKFLGRMG